MSARIPIGSMLAMLRALKRAPRSRAELIRRTRISRAAFFRHIQYLRMLDVIVRFDRHDGVYYVQRWGLINPKKL